MASDTKALEAPFDMFEVLVSVSGSDLTLGFDEHADAHKAFEWFTTNAPHLLTFMRRSDEPLPDTQDDFAAQFTEAAPGVIFTEHEYHPPLTAPPQPTGEDAELVAEALAYTHDLSHIHADVNNLIDSLATRLATVAAELEGARNPTDQQIKDAYAAGMRAVPGSTGRPCDKQDVVFMRGFLAALASDHLEGGD